MVAIIALPVTRKARTRSRACSTRKNPT